VNANQVPGAEEDKAARIAVLIELFDRKGIAQYDGEAVSQTSHALQCAALAASEGARSDLVAAALLHDVGHLLSRATADEKDDRHHEIGAGFLSNLFDAEVYEPVRLHVSAKRWLCSVDPDYHATLSPASVASLGLQGGPMTQAEALAFSERAFAEEAVAVRRWDDRAKDPAVVVPPLEYYRDLLLRLAR
jgi:gamma-butyrobetaine dioxygenase